MPATAPAGAQSWVAGTRMQLTRAGPRSGSSPGHGLLPPSRTQVTRRHACRWPLELGQGSQLSAAGPDACNASAVVASLYCPLHPAAASHFLFWILAPSIQMLPQLLLFGCYLYCFFLL